MSIKYDIADLVNNMIELEICGHRFYTSQARKSNNPLLVQLFDMLAEQEKRHKLVYETLLMKMDHEVDIADEDYHAYLKEIIAGKFNLDPDTAESCSDPIEVLDMAMQLENDSIRFVEAFGKLIGSTHRNIVDQIRMQENNHLKLLTAMKQKLIEG